MTRAQSRSSQNGHLSRARFSRIDHLATPGGPPSLTLILIRVRSLAHFSMVLIIRQALSVTPPTVPATEPLDAGLNPSQHEPERKGKDKAGAAAGAALATQIAEAPGKITVEASIDRDNMRVRG